MMKASREKIISSKGIPGLLIYFLCALIFCGLFANNLKGQVTDTFYVKAGWNLISLSLDVDNRIKDTLFPTNVSKAFVYNAVYVSKDSLETGEGFWLKFDSDETFILTGESIHRDTIDVYKGWNIIGSITNPINLNLIFTDPPGIINSEFFNYVSEYGYRSSDTIHPGFGYWLKVNQDGSLILSSPGLPCPGVPTVEYAGKIYNTVQIGSQCWLKENLDVGSMVDSLQNQTDNDTIEKYCYRNNPVNCNMYGGFYQWDEAMQYATTPGARGICPDGWHIPTYEEYRTCSTAVSGDGNAIKAIGEGSLNGAGTNTSGFSALLAGWRDYDGNFYDLVHHAAHWSSTVYGSIGRRSMCLYDTNSYLGLGSYNYRAGFSIRCIRD